MTRKLLIGAAVLALVALAVVDVVRWRLDRGDAALEASWRKALGGASFLERYPPTEDNATVVELNRLGEQLGLDMAGAQAVERTNPAPDAAERFAALSDELRSYLDPTTAPEDGIHPPPPAAVAAFVDEARPTIDALVALLTTGPPPVWEWDLGRAFEAPVPNYVGILNLQKLLAVEAVEQIRRGNPERTLAVLEASWRLDEAIRATPTLTAQLISQAGLKYQQLALRGLAAALPVWRQRMATIDLRGGVYIGLQLEAFLAHHAAYRERPLGSEEIPPWSDTTMRWGLRDYAQRFQPMIEELVRRDVRSLDPEEFTVEMAERLPRWSMIARLMLPNFWDSWPKAAHGELSADLTARILEQRARQAAGGPPRPSDRQPSRVRGLDWLYEETPAGTSVRLDGEMVYKPPRALPLHFLVRPQHRPSRPPAAPGVRRGSPD